MDPDAVFGRDESEALYDRGKSAGTPSNLGSGHHVDCRETASIIPRTKEAGLVRKQSRTRATGIGLHTSPNGGAASQWERPGCDWPNAPSCACLGTERRRASTLI